MRKMALIGVLAVGSLGFAAPAWAQACATVYEHARFGGESRDVPRGASVSNLGSLWNDVISSVSVEPGCALNVWEHANFDGAHTTFIGSVPWVGRDWNDRISSYNCTCQ